MRMSIRHGHGYKHRMRLIKSLPDRMVAMEREIPRRLAMRLDSMLKSEATNVADVYPNNLRVTSFDMPQMDNVFGTWMDVSGVKVTLRTSDAQRMIIKVKAKSRDGVADPGALVLENRGPWTMETLPYEPHPKDAKMTSTMVSRREVVAVASRRSAERESVDRELEIIGVKPHRASPVLLSRKVTYDVVQEVAMIEYGIGDVHRTHLRPAMQELRKSGVRAEMRRLSQWYSAYANSEWKKAKSTPRGSSKNVRHLKAFQDIILGKS